MAMDKKDNIGKITENWKPQVWRVLVCFSFAHRVLTDVQGTFLRGDEQKMEENKSSGN